MVHNIFLSSKTFANNVKHAGFMHKKNQVSCFENIRGVELNCGENNAINFIQDLGVYNIIYINFLMLF